LKLLVSEKKKKAVLQQAVTTGLFWFCFGWIFAVMICAMIW